MKIASLLATVVLALSAGAALADDARWPSDGSGDNAKWRGLYLNGSIGYGVSDSSQSIAVDNTNDGVIDSFGRSDIDADGFIGTVGVGYDLLLGRGFLLGVFGDYTFGDIDDSYSILGNSIHTTYDNIWAVGGRLGYMVHTDLLLFGTAGYTSADLTSATAGGVGKDDLDGYFVGVGLERKLCDNLFLKAEYRYSDLGETNVTALGGSCGGACRTDIDFDHEIHTVRVGLSLKFNRPEDPPAPLK